MVEPDKSPVLKGKTLPIAGILHFNCIDEALETRIPGEGVGIGRADR
jgi:hypothetical protein